jgi:ferric-dicitrate binding protein FerR (iron transport regulator)
MSIAARSRRHRRGQRRRRLYAALLALVAGAGWWYGGSGDLQPRFATSADRSTVARDGYEAEPLTAPARFAAAAMRKSN